ncbi:polysaccharide pyruvyl transferase family protein [Methanothermococcus sp. SCGC AD-155-C09]|nr:polysaccharide pyruvyl transferase family protein [Methanothermococcus sp. SCGC AD-155-C09]
MKKYGFIMALTENLGDDIQALAAKQFLPRADVILNREFLNQVNSKDTIKTIMNGWFTHRPDNWPPSSNIEPLFLSFHISPHIADKLLSRKTLEYLKKYEPIGCRDEYTRDLLESRGINAYFSGCLTLTLDYGYNHLKNHKKQKEYILIVDLDDYTTKHLPQHILRRSMFASHTHSKRSVKLIQKILPHTFRKALRSIFPINDKILSSIELSFEKRLKLAEIQLQKLANAQMVITSRLHAALPAISFGTPVIFVHENLNDPRFTGLLKYINHYNISEFKKQVNEIDWENPPQNPSQEELRKLKSDLINKCLEFVKDI